MTDIVEAMYERGDLMTTAVDTVEIAGPVEVLDVQPGEMRVRFPVIAVEGMDTRDGRLIDVGEITAGMLPMSVLAQLRSPHGGDDPPAATVVGRLDTLVRRPGPEVISKRTGQPFPEGTFVWSGTGAIGTDVEADGHNVADLVRRRFLRGVSADLLPTNYTIFGEDGFAPDPENPSRRAVVHAGEIGGVTLVPIAAFGECYVELADENEVPVPIKAGELPQGLMASAVPAWRAPEVGDEWGLHLAALTAAADKSKGSYVAQMRDRVLTELGDGLDWAPQDVRERLTDLYTLLALTTGPGTTSATIHDAWAVATARTDANHPSLVPFEELSPAVQTMDDRYRDAVIAAASDPDSDGSVSTDTPTGKLAHDEPYTGSMVALVPANATQLAVDGGLPADELHLTLAYLGDDVTGWDDQRRKQLLAAAQRAAEHDPPVQARVFGHALFNPGGYGDRDPCAVYLVGESSRFTELRTAFSEFADVTQHEPFIAHITGGYELDVGALSYTGPVTFDRLRVALAEDVTDFPLCGDPATDDPAGDGDNAVVAAAPTAPQRRDAEEEGDTYPGTDKFPLDTRERAESAVRLHGSSDIPAEKVRAWLIRRLKAKGWEDLIPDSWLNDSMSWDDKQRNAVVAAAAAISDALGPAEAQLLTFNLFYPNGLALADGVLDLPCDDEDALLAAAGQLPRMEWFADPRLPGPTEHTVEGRRVWGHLALWDIPHIGANGQAIYPPRNKSGYRWFHSKSALVEGPGGPERIRIGHITFDTGHAGIHLGFRAAAEHYDHSGCRGARVRMGEDQHGIWYAGALVSSLEGTKLEEFYESGTSGDWRRILGNLELVAALAVNVEGFPKPTESLAASGEPLALVAAGTLPPRVDSAVVLDYDTLADALAVRLDQRRRDGELSVAHAALVEELDDTPAVVAALLAEVDDAPERVTALLAELDTDGGVFDVSRMPPQLQREWLAGGIAARIAWGTPGSFRRCQAIAQEKGIPARQRDGMCANLYHTATGKHPGRHQGDD